MILTCPNATSTCKDTYQDQKHGTGNRVYTEPGQGGKDGCKCTCTVCGREMSYLEAKKVAVR